MGLFNKKSKKEEEKLPELPDLPELPKLPELSNFREPHNQLPRFPNSSLGNKFSQDTIKEAVSGKKESDSEGFADEFDSFDEDEMMQEPLERSPKIREIGEDYEIPEERPLKKMKSLQENSKKMKSEMEPLFIRLDKFEETQDALDEIKKQMEDIGKLLDKTKELKAEEEDKLKTWESELHEVKKKIEHIDHGLFSKL
ncbi:MAG: hypothetical protein KC516_00085 [Nanoarchaeota archaeon]|nr:hypothetical protein [Nanoarchaeota archaeon]